MLQDLDDLLTMAISCATDFLRKPSTALYSAWRQVPVSTVDREPKHVLFSDAFAQVPIAANVSIWNARKRMDVFMMPNVKVTGFAPTDLQEGEEA